MDSNDTPPDQWLLAAPLVDPGAKKVPPYLIEHPALELGRTETFIRSSSTGHIMRLRDVMIRIDLGKFKLLGATVMSSALVGGFSVGSHPLAIAVEAKKPPRLVVSTTPIPPILASGEAFASTINARNPGKVATRPTVVTISLPPQSAGGPRVAVSPAPNITCSTPKGHPSQLACTVPKTLAHGTVAVASAAGTPPSAISAAGASISLYTRGPTNATRATWRWKLPDLVGSLTLSPSSIELGNAATGVLTIANQGGATATPFTTVIPMKTPATLISQPPGAICIPYYSELDCYLPGLGTSASAGITFSYTPRSGPTASLSGTVDAYNNVLESNKNNNTFSSNAITIVGTGADLSLSFDEPASVNQGTELVRGVIITNKGDTPAQNVTFTDNSGWFPYFRTDSGGTCAPYYTGIGRGGRVYAGVSCAVGTIPADSQAKVYYEYIISAHQSPATYNAAVRVATSTPQTTSSTPSGTATIAVTVPSSPVSPSLIVPPALAGIAVVGDDLSTTAGSWNGTPTITQTYQWQQCDANGANCADISQATQSTYTVQESDIGLTIRAAVIATNGGGGTTTYSTVSAAVIPAQLPRNTTAPSISGGDPQPNFRWYSSPGSWTGTPTIVFAYQWQLCNGDLTTCNDIQGATGTFYDIQTGDIGSRLRLRVTAANSAGPVIAYSNASGVIEPYDG
ncbi:MAG TPA: CARDB domain-containing protein [Chloroflexota bacterium]|jgi:hypothetical protein|nr:CARDB domain-containing protein [Chloroflexota bacterium]